jgi:hypothetical protein
MEEDEKGGEWKERAKADIWSVLSIPKYSQYIEIIKITKSTNVCLLDLI